MGVLSRLCSVATFCKALSVRLSHIFVDVLCSALSPQSDNDQSAQLIPRKERKGTEEDLSWHISKPYGADCQYIEPIGHKRGGDASQNDFY